MSAASRTARISVKVSELDKNSGVKLHTSRLEYTYDSEDGDEGKKIEELEVDGKVIGDARVEFVAKALVKSEGKIDDDKTSVTITVYDEDGYEVESATGKDFAAASSGVGLTHKLRNGYEIVISYTVDNLTAGYPVDGNTTGDDIDDRNQAIVSIARETRIGSGIYSQPKKGEDQYVVNKGDNLSKLVLSEEYEDFIGYDEVEYDKDDNEYVLVYNNELTKVEGNVTVNATWTKNTKSLDRFVGEEAEEEKEYDELDANKDGVVSCEEALGKGWVWNNETSACELKGSSNTGSYVPNTATK